MFGHLHNIQLKLLFSVVLLLLLTIVINVPPFLQKVVSASDTHIVAVGDWGCSENTKKTVQDVKSMNPQLLLALGDYSMDKTTTCWFDIIKPVQSITKINIGNHDAESIGKLDSILNHFGLSKQFYSFDINNIHVLTMASEEEPKTNSDQYNFVVNDLRKAANNPDIKWIIVSLHRPIYTSPSASAPSISFRDPYHPLFDQYGVDLVLQGHNHNYQRTFPLNYNPTDPSNPIATSTDAGDYKNPNGAVFAIVGTGGDDLHWLSGSAPFVVYQQDKKFGLLDMHFSDNKLDAKYVTDDGATMDDFSISKTANKNIIERISDNIDTETNAKAVSDNEDTKVKPLTEEEVKAEDKPSITYKLKDDAATDTKADTKVKPLTDKKEDTKVKPLTDKKEDTKVKPLTEEEVKAEDDKPYITYKLKDDAATDTKADTKAKAVSDKEEDTKAKAVSDKEEEEDKPAVTTKLSDNPPTDDKPETQHNVDKADLSDEGKSTDDKSHVEGLLGSSDSKSLVADDDDETTDSDEETINTNERDPFAALN